MREEALNFKLNRMSSFSNLSTPNDSTVTKGHIFSKSELFQSWNLYICMLSVLLNLVGNPVIIWVIFKTPSMHSFTHYLFVNLAISDVALGISSIVSFTVRETMKEGSTHLPLDWICKLVHTCPIPAISMIVSSYTLTAITCERFYHISQPFKARVAQRNTKLIVGLIWSAAIILVLPVAVYTSFDYDKHSCHIAVPHLAIYVIFITLLAFLLPLGLMFYCYYQTVRILWFSERSQCHIPANTVTLRKHRKKVTKFLGIVIGLFIGCSVPVAAMLIARRYTSVPTGLFFSSVLLAMFSSSVNPVIFMLQNSQFRESLKNLVKPASSTFIQPTTSVTNAERQEL